MYNSTGTVKIKAIDQNNCAISGESAAITVNFQPRKYTDKYTNTTVNNYDSIISSEVNSWTNWQIPSGTPYTFITGATPEIDLVKAIAYKESSLSSAQEPDLMQVTPALTAMGNNGNRDSNASAVPNGNGCYSLCEGAPFMNYNASINSVTDGFHWGIRWFIAKHSEHDYDISPCTDMVSNMRLLSVTDTLTAYRGDPIKDPNYAQYVLDLYNEGKNPNEGSPTYLWPIKSDFCPRQ